MIFKSILNFLSTSCCLSVILVLISLAGYPPFSDSVQGMTLYDQILKGHYSFPEMHWGTVSNEGEFQMD